MPHLTKEIHINDICVSCKKPHERKNLEIIHQHHKIYEIITCLHCGYENMRVKPEEQFSSKLDFL